MRFSIYYNIISLVVFVSSHVGIPNIFQFILTNLDKIIKICQILLLFVFSSANTAFYYSEQGSIKDQPAVFQ